MTGYTGTALGADRGWLAKVLAGDRLACGLLELARNLPADEWDAFAQRCERTLTYVPAAAGLQRGRGARRHRR